MVRTGGAEYHSLKSRYTRGKTKTRSNYLLIRGQSAAFIEFTGKFMLLGKAMLAVSSIQVLFSTVKSVRHLMAEDCIRNFLPICRYACRYRLLRQSKNIKCSSMNGGVAEG